MNKKEKVSVIVPIYNGEKYISRCIASVLSQNYMDIELILVNDGSLDNSLEICNFYAEKDNRIVVLNQTNQGVSAARNNGLRFATGDFFTFIDVDDCISSGTLSVALKYLEEYKADVAVYGWEKIYVSKNQSESVYEEFEIIEDSKIAIKKILENYSACGGGYPWNKLWRKSAIDKLQYFDEILFYFEDLEWVVRMMKQIKRVVICPECLYKYYIHEGSISTDNSRAESKETSYHMALKKIIDELGSIPELQLWIKEKYFPEIVNGIVHAQRRNWFQLERYLKEQLKGKKRSILKSANISLKTKFRCLRLLLF